MNLDWQIVVVVLAGILSAGLLARRAWQAFHGNPAGSCGSTGCNDCPSNATSSKADLVQLDVGFTDHSKKVP